MTQISSNPFLILDERLSNIETILSDLKRLNMEPASTANVEDIGGMSLAEHVTGLAKPTLYALVSQRKIPFMKQSKRLYFSRHELTEWIKAGRKKTLAEKAQEASSCLAPKRKRAIHGK